MLTSNSFCVVLPAVAQLVVNNSDLVLLSARLMDPTPSSVVMTIKSAIKLPIALPVRVNAFPMSLLVRDMPGNNTYAKVYLPDSVIHGNTTLGEENHLTPLNLPVWRQYVRNVLFQETVPLSLHGRTEQHLGELHSMVTLNKDVPLNGVYSTPCRFTGLTFQASIASRASLSTIVRFSFSRTRTGQTSLRTQPSRIRAHSSWRSYGPFCVRLTAKLTISGPNSLQCEEW